MAQRVKYFIIIILVAISAQLFEISAQEAVTSESVTTNVGNPTSLPDSGGGGENSGGGSTTPPGEFPFYCQGDPRWANRCAMASAACGPTSMTMVLSYFGEPVTPPEIDAIYNARGYRACANVGSDMFTAIDVMLKKERGYNVRQLLYVDPKSQGPSQQLDLAQAKEFIDEGYLLIGSVNIHIFVIDAVDVDRNMVHLRDPAVCNPAGTWNPNGTPWIGASGTGYYWFYAYAVKK